MFCAYVSTRLHCSSCGGGGGEGGEQEEAFVLAWVEERGLRGSVKLGKRLVLLYRVACVWEMKVIGGRRV